MGLNDTPVSERIHIGFFGVRNAGKSSLVNAVTGQELSVVSEVKGTTTDPVKKTMELLPLGPVVIIDTPGIDDEGTLGEQRVKKTRQILAKTDIAVLVADASKGLSEADRKLISLFEERKLPYIVAYNKSDLVDTDKADENAPDAGGEAAGENAPGAGAENTGENAGSTALTGQSAKAKLKDNEIYVSAITGENIYALKEMLGAFANGSGNNRKLVADLLNPGDIVVLVIPIDESAPKSRLILPQQMVMRDILDAHCTFIACQDTELKQTIASLAVRPRLVITDSQAFARVAKDTPPDIEMTSFSILFARYKGELETLVKGASMLSGLNDGDKVLISEGCTHHRQCNDIGTVKLPGWIENYCGSKPEFEFTSGGEFPETLKDYKLVVHCGGCMLNEKEMKRRVAQAEGQGVLIVNYGIAIACMNGILKRSLEPFPDILNALDSGR